MSIPTLDYVLRERGPAVQHTLVWLHGLGADGYDFAPLVDALALPPGLGLRVVLPHAPLRAVTINGGARMRAWYDFRNLEFGRGEATEDIEDSIDLIHRLLAAERDRLPVHGKLLLGGFSQGGVMALAAGLRADPQPDALVVLSAYLWGALPKAGPIPPAFQAHGEQDPVIPLAAGRAANRQLEALGMDTEWHVYPTGHTVCPEEIEDLSRWLLRVLAL